MSEENEGKDEQPALGFPKKKVDSSWKEEVRKEKEKAREADKEKDEQASEKGDGAKKAPPGEPSKVFLNFIAGLIQQVLMQLGKMESPFTGGREVDLEGARYTIEILTVLKEKTAGNLAEKEEQMLSESVSELKFHYIEAAKAAETKTAPEQPPKP